MNVTNYFIFLITSLFTLNIFSQETLPVYQDYLSDNVYLVHPAAAGIGETGKIRVAIRMEGFGVANSPQLQTANFHGKFKEDSKAAFGIVLVNNSTSTSFSQKALQLTYGYHLDLDQTTNFEQLSFGLSITGVQAETGSQFVTTGVTQTTQPFFYLNASIGIAYHLKGLSSYFTVKNLNLTADDAFFSSSNEFNLRNYIFGASYFFGAKEALQHEPSFLIQYKEDIEEKIIDVNYKVYKNFDDAQIWGALSYRNSIGSTSFNDTKYMSAIVGINFNKMMFSYTYTKQLDSIVLNSGVFHQLSIGLNVLPSELKLPANPNINGVLF